MTRKNISFVPSIPDELAQRVLPSSDIAINSINISIESLNDFARLLPTSYGWRFRTVEALKAELLELKLPTPFKVNRLYWEDMLKTCEAYMVMASWRIVELARSCVWALGREDTLCAAIVARSALESTAQFVHFARKTSATLDTCAQADLHQDLIASSELECELIKTVFASRLPSSEKIYHPTNIITVVEHVSRIKDQGYVKTTHEELSEITHPNFLGRSIYIMDSKANARDGDETRTLSLGRGPTADFAIASTLRGSSWACMTHVTSALLLQNSIRSFMLKLSSKSKV
jgi:hypothetical protein